MEDNQAYERAKRRAEEKIEFFTHLAVYAVVNVVLIVINLLTSRGYYWFYWPLLGWGIGIAFHAMNTFVYGEGSSWKERLIQKELEKQQPKSK